MMNKTMALLITCAGTVGVGTAGICTAGVGTAGVDTAELGTDALGIVVHDTAAAEHSAVHAVHATDTAADGTAAKHCHAAGCMSD